MTNGPLVVKTENQVTHLHLNRPDKCNALDGPLVDQLHDAIFDAGRDSNTQLVLLTGAGKHFCAGADVDWMRKLSQSSFELCRDDARSLASLLYFMHTFPKPIITLAQGSTVGGGLGLLACSDVVIAAEDAAFCFSEVKLGLVPAVISPYVISLIGQQAARSYFLTAERFQAAEALRLGLVHQVVPLDKLSEAGEKTTQTLLKNSPAALAEVKRLVPLVANQEISLELSEKTAEIFAKMRISAEAREGLNAFLEKRAPAWEKIK